jgi:hypothetical protein
MRSFMKIATVAGLLALSASPAFAQGKPEGVPPHGKGHGNGPIYAPANPPSPGPSATLPEKAKAYGRYCQGESKKHVAGQPGTPFSHCVTTMAKAAQHPKMSPGQVCKGKSKKHVKGEKGTAFSRCVNAAAKLRHDEAQQGS